MPFYDDPLVHFDDPAIFYDDPGLGYTPGSPPLNVSSISLGNSAMEYWETTKERATITLAVWRLHVPTQEIGGVDADEFEAFIDQFEPKAQARTTAQDDFDEGVRVLKTSLLKMKILGTKVPQIIDGQVPGNAGIIDDLADIYRIAPRFEPSILARARGLYPVWVRANTALAGLTPPAAPITRPIGGVAQTAVMLKALLDGYTDVAKERDDKGALLDQKRSDLRALDRTVDQLNKNWYQVVKATYDAGSPVRVALEQIPVEEGTPAPDTIDIHEVLQGGVGGLHVLVSYEAGGGDHATTREIQWMVQGVDADFTHTAPLDSSGNALGPFTVGQVVKVRTSVSNSTGTRTSAVRTITVGAPVI